MGQRFMQLTVGGRLFRLPCDPEAFHITYRDDLRRSDRLEVERGVGPAGPRLRYEVPDQRITVLKTSGDGQGDRFTSFEAVDALRGRAEVEMVRPLAIYGGKRIAVSDRIAIRARAGYGDVGRRLVERGLKVVDSSDDILLCRVVDGSDTFAKAAQLAAEPWVIYAEPDLVTVGSRLRPAPGALLSYTSSVRPSAVQRAFQQIQADAAWATYCGRPEVRVAVLDDGGDATHPALRDIVVRNFDAISGMEGQPPNPWDSHGTACAGLIAGVDERTDFRGVAAGCELMMVRIARSPQPGMPWATASSTIRRGIDWAVDNGADVLSNSWGGGAPSQIVLEGFERAVQVGRKGRGCIVVAAGNEAGDVLFPGTLASVLMVSGVNAIDEFKTPYSSDGETWWGSNYGLAVDIAAPSVGLFTTDNVGQNGRSPTDYLAGFNGTSAAAPLVAGAAAMILSLNGDLREEQVRNILCRTADKVGGDEYRDDRNNQVGSGRLNLLRALHAVTHVERTEGELVRVDPWGGGPLFVLRRADGTGALLSTASANTSPAASGLLDQNERAFSGYVGMRIAVEHFGAVATPLGPVLLRARVVKTKSRDPGVTSTHDNDAGSAGGTLFLRYG